MRWRNPVYTLPQGAFFIHINGDHINHVSRHKSYSWMENGMNRRESFSFGVMPSSNIPDLAESRQDLLLPNSRIGTFIYRCINININIYNQLIIFIYILNITCVATSLKWSVQCRKQSNLYILWVFCEKQQ